MKKNGYIICICVTMLITGCSRTTLQHEQTRISIKSDTIQRSLLHDSTSESKEEIKTIESDSSSYSIMYNFDTEKPVNTETGLPPVKSITVTGSIKNEKKDITNTSRKEKTINNLQEKKSATTINTKSDSTNKTHSDIIPFKIQILLFIVGICIIFWDKIKSFFIKIWKG